MYVHALHAVHAVPDLRFAAGRLRDGVSFDDGALAEQGIIESASGAQGLLEQLSDRMLERQPRAWNYSTVTAVGRLLIQESRA